MKKFRILTNRAVSPEEQKSRLAQVYSLILSWPEPSNTDTADRGDFGEKTQPAAETLAQDEQSA